MIINLSPQLRDDKLTVIKKGDILIVDEKEYDFSVIPEGATLPSDATDCKWFVGGIHRINGDLNLTIILPHDSNASESARFPNQIINPVDGTLELPK